jgi:hypothetical protein
MPASFNLIFIYTKTGSISRALFFNTLELFQDIFLSKCLAWQSIFCLRSVPRLCDIDAGFIYGRLGALQ